MLDLYPVSRYRDGLRNSRRDFRLLASLCARISPPLADCKSHFAVEKSQMRFWPAIAVSAVEIVTAIFPGTFGAVDGRAGWPSLRAKPKRKPRKRLSPRCLTTICRSLPMRRMSIPLSPCSLGPIQSHAARVHGRSAQQIRAQLLHPGAELQPELEVASFKPSYNGGMTNCVVNEGKLFRAENATLAGLGGLSRYIVTAIRLPGRYVVTAIPWWREFECRIGNRRFASGRLEPRRDLTGVTT
jgi:hypothetical protein